MIIERVSDKTIVQVASLESQIDSEHAANLSTLIARQKMFQDGFLVAIQNGAVIGYVESCLWDRTEFHIEDFDFPKYHNPSAKSLYVIFLATHPDHRNSGIGSQLMLSIQNLATRKGMERIILAARDEYVGFYSKLGFHIVRALPNFLLNAPCTQMEWVIERPET
jgi:ribosomal protein S18 acetylase RimI-like enzyme